MIERQYYIIWKQLKELCQKSPAEQSKGVSVVIHRGLHSRVLKAVKKEKWKDMAFKLELDDKYAILYHSRSGSILTLYLKIFSYKESHVLSKQFTEEDF